MYFIKQPIKNDLQTIYIMVNIDDDLVTASK